LFIAVNIVAEPLVLCSTITKLAYVIGQRFYREKHFVWCAPLHSKDVHLPPNPPSSDPIVIYSTLLKDVKGNDKHSAKIAENKIGLLRGAEIKEREGVITLRQMDLIAAMIESAEISAFSPMMIVTPYKLVKKLIVLPEISDIASATSQEYRIEALPSKFFEVLRLEVIHG
jgi:hypothetical protein